MASLALIVEDGSGVSGANSYASLETIIDYAEARGVLLPDSPVSTVLNWAILGMDYIESFAARFKGIQTSWDQSLSWPRRVPISVALVWDVFSDPYSWERYPTKYVSVNGVWVQNNAIPKILVACQCQLVIEQYNGVQLFQTSNPNETVKMQKIGPLTTEYFQADNQPLMPAVDALLNPLLDVTASAFLRSARV